MSGRRCVTKICDECGNPTFLRRVRMKNRDTGTARYEFHPDIVVNIAAGKNNKADKTIIVECETTPNGMLKDDTRMTAYKLLRLQNLDTNKLMMYLAMPSEFKGKIEKPDFFNDLWFIDLKPEGVS